MPVGSNSDMLLYPGLFLSGGPKRTPPFGHAHHKSSVVTPSGKLVGLCVAPASYQCQRKVELMVDLFQLPSSSFIVVHCMHVPLWANLSTHGRPCALANSQTAPFDFMPFQLIFSRLRQLVKRTVSFEAETVKQKLSPDDDMQI